MKPQEALTMIDGAISTIQTDRKAHVTLQQAIQVVREIIEPKKDSKDEVKK